MQCGLCAVVAGLFRRAMCIAGSRRGSGESSSYQELPPATNTDCAPDNAQRPAPEIMLGYSAEQNTLMQQISEDAKVSNKLSSLSDVEEKDHFDEGNSKFDEIEQLLLDKFDVSASRPKHTGRFLTMHKRRRKRLITRSLDQDPALLDDIFHGQVKYALDKSINWNFNAFTLEAVSGGRSLSVLCVHLFHWYGLLEYFQLDVVRVWKLFTLIEEGYHSTNPYHNSIHACDVTQAMHCFLQEKQIRTNLTYLEIMSSLIAAVTHDLDHPGVNQPFLVATSNHLAALYENTSVLENHHWRSAISCLLESGVSEQLPDHLKPDLQSQVSSLILATDITRQQEFLTRFKQYLDNRELDMQEPEHRHFILQIALKCADISNPARPWDISRKWTHKVCEEFFRQGDYERQLNLPVTSLCDRLTTSIPRIQTGFFKFVVLPLYEEWHRFLNDEFSTSLMQSLLDNQQYWDNMLQEEMVAAAAASGQSISPGRDSITSRGDSATVIELPSQEATSECTEEDSGSSLELAAMPGGLAPPPISSDARRHSVPVGMSRNLTLAPHSTTSRRESLPSSGKHSLMPSRVSSRASLHRGSTAGFGAGTMMMLTSFPSPSASVSERPVSAENLLPDTSIASIANSLEASKLSSLVQRQTWDNQLIDQSTSARQQGTLTRQQTFPPVQPYARVRYMSTTAEMSQCCTEVLFEADSSSSRSVSPAEALIGSPSPSTSLHTPSLSVAVPVPQGTIAVTPGTTSGGPGELRRHSTPAQSKARGIGSCASSSRGPQGVPNTGRRFTTIPLTQEAQTRDSNNKVFFIGSPPDSPPRLASATPSSDSGSGGPSGSTSGGANGGTATGGGGSIGGSGTSGIQSKKSADSLSLPGNKRDYSDSTKDKSLKMPKLMKENVDPRAYDEFNKSSYLPSRRSNNQSWARRRGSAPVGLLSIRVDDATIPSNRAIDHSCRRGSVPADITAHPNGGVNRVSLSVRSDKLSMNQRRSSLPYETTLGNLLGNISQFADQENYNNNNNNIGGSNNNGFSRPGGEGGLSVTSAILSSRRGSVPADISELRRNINNGANGKSRNNRSSCKKLLRRRSSGGPEMFASGQNVSPADGNDNATWSSSRSKREFSKRDSSSINEPLPSLAKRRGSLPIDMLALSLTGRYIHR